MVNHGEEGPLVKLAWLDDFSQMRHYNMVWYGFPEECFMKKLTIGQCEFQRAFGTELNVIELVSDSRE
jgi:hypothetical protein